MYRILYRLAFYSLLISYSSHLPGAKNTILEHHKQTPSPCLEISQTKPNTLTQIDFSNLNAPTFEYRILFDSAFHTSNQPLSQSGLYLKNATLLSQDQILKAPDLIWEPTSKNFKASGEVILQTPSISLNAQSAEGNLISKQLELLNTTYRLNLQSGRGSAQQVSLEQNAPLTLKKISYTTCPANDNSWRISAGKLSLDTNAGWGKAHNMTLHLGDIPVFYFPYLLFPIDDRRLSGLLTPTIHDNQRNGFDITLPIYWNIALQMDATITPRLIEKRGEQLNLEFRHLSRFGSSLTELEWLPNDELITSPTASLDRKRWFYRLNNHYRFSPHWFFHLNASDVSDSFYLSDLKRGLAETNRDALSQMANLGFQHDRLNTHIIWSRFTPLQSTVTPFETRPALFFNTLLSHPDSLIHWSIHANTATFDNADPTQITGRRSQISSQISAHLQNSWSFVIPSLEYESTLYQLDPSNSLLERRLTRELPKISLDSGLFFERRSSRWLQTLEPRLYWLYVPFRDQTRLPVFDTSEPEWSFERLFESNRFEGQDRVSDSQQLSVAMTHRWINAQTGHETLQLSLGQAFYRQPRQVTLPNLLQNPTKQSPLITDLTWSFSPKHHLHSMLVYNTENEQTEEGYMGWTHTLDDKNRVKVAYRSKRNRAIFREQSEIAFNWSVSSHWQFFGHWQHDWRQNQDLEHQFGIQYDSCCWSFKLAHRRYLNTRSSFNLLDSAKTRELYNQDIVFQITLSGFGNTQKNPSAPLFEDHTWVQPPNY